MKALILVVLVLHLLLPASPVKDCPFSSSLSQAASFSSEPCVVRAARLRPLTPDSRAILADPTSYLLDALPGTLQTAIGPLNDTVFYYSSAAPLARLKGVSFHSVHSWGPRPLRELLLPSPEHDHPRYYCSLPYKDLPKEARRDLQRLLDPFFFSSSSSSSSSSSLSSSSSSSSSSLSWWWW